MNKYKNEIERKSDNDYNKWYEKRREELGKILIQALCISMDTSDIYKMGDTIEKWIKDLNLPDEKCSMCGKVMIFFDYHLKQGICDECAIKIEKEMEE
jgi:hypothetical protein